MFSKTVRKNKRLFTVRYFFVPKHGSPYSALLACNSHSDRVSHSFLTIANVLAARQLTFHNQATVQSNPH